MTTTGRITPWFNAGLILYLIGSLSIDYLLTPEPLEPVPWDQIFQGTSPFLRIALLAILIFLTVYIGAIFTKHFWNRFIADVFQVRTIIFDEALALVLVGALLAI